MRVLFEALPWPWRWSRSRWRAWRPTNASSSIDPTPATSTPRAPARWFTLTLEQLYSDTEDFGFPDLTAAQVEYAANLSLDSGVPASFTFRADKTLLEDAAGWQKNGHSTDGKGIDHFFDVYGETLIGALFAALANA